MADKSTNILSDEQLQALIDKAQSPSGKPAHSNKPIAKNQSHASNKPQAKNTIPGSVPSGFKDRGKKLATIDHLSRKHLNQIMQARFPEFTVKEIVGEGGFANVYRLEQADEDENLALKVIDPFMAYKCQHTGKNTSSTLGDLQSDSSFKSLCDHIDTEFQINQIIHDRQLANCVRFYPEYSFIDDSIRSHVGFIVMALMDGSLVNRPEGLPKNVENWRIAYEMLKDILDEVRFLSEHNGETNIFVRDVKPSNILYKIVNRRINYYLSDFGMGSIGFDYSSNTKFMSPGFSAPESDKDIRSDLFSFARTAFYICNNFSLGETEHDRASFFQAEQRKEAEYWNNTPEAFRSILQKATSPSPDDRYQTVSKMLKDIQSLDFEKEQIYIDKANDTLAKRLGNVELRHQAEVEKLQKKIDDLEEELRQSNANPSAAGTDSSAISQISELNQLITSKNEEIKSLKASLQKAEDKAKRYEGAAAHVDTHNEQLITENNDLKGQLEARDKRIKDLETKEKQLASLQPKVTQMQEKITELETEKDNNLKKLSQLQHDADGVESLSEKVDSLRSKLKEANDKAASLSSQVTSLSVEKEDLVRQLESVRKGSPLLLDHPNATLVNHGWDILKTFGFLAWFIYLYYNQMLEMLPRFFLAYGIVILASALTSNITLSKQIDKFWRYVFTIILGLPSLLFVLAILEQYLGFSTKFPAFTAPIFGNLRLGTISSFVLLALYMLEDSVVTYAKNMKNTRAEANDMANLFQGLNILATVLTAMALIVRLWFPSFLTTTGVIRVSDPAAIASYLHNEGVYYDSEKEQIVFDGATIDRCLEFNGDVKILIKGSVSWLNNSTNAPLIKVNKGTLRIYSEQGSSLAMNNALGEDIYADRYVYAASSTNLNGSFTCNSANACIFAGINTNITKRTAAFQNNSEDSSAIIAWSDDMSTYDETTVVIDGVETSVKDLGNGFRYDEEKKRLVMENLRITTPMEFKGSVSLQLIGDNAFINETGQEVPMIRVTGGSLRFCYEENSSLSMVNDYGQDLLVDGNIYVQDPRMDGMDKRSFTCTSGNACIYTDKGAYMNLSDTTVVNNGSGGLINYGHH